MKILFLLKKNYNYSSSYSYPATKASGLLNSASFVSQTLNLIGYTSNLEICVDGNEIDKYLHKYKPDVCIIEALWVTPMKIAELCGLHKQVLFIIRIHSNIPFLSNEGIAIDWIKKYSKIDNVEIAFNNSSTVKDFELVGIEGMYLPNIYSKTKFMDSKFFFKLGKYYFSKLFDKSLYNFRNTYINIGCFCAIRPIKNMLIQAMAAMAYADATGKILIFHINATRVEQQGESTLKNIQALFLNTQHFLVEHGWMSHEVFLELIRYMDLGMQLSQSESFNIVTADFVSQNVPIIVSKEISWMPSITKSESITNIPAITEKISDALRNRELFIELSEQALEDFNLDALQQWNYFLHQIKK